MQNQKVSDFGYKPVQGIVVPTILFSMFILTGCESLSTSTTPTHTSSSTLPESITAESDNVEEYYSPTPTSTLPIISNTIPEKILNLAIEDLSLRLGILDEQILMLSADEIQWNDSALGCPMPGIVYAQVISPGYLLVLEALGEKYEYHTDTDVRLVLCSQDGFPNWPPIPIDPDEIQDGIPWMPVDP